MFAKRNYKRLSHAAHMIYLSMYAWMTVCKRMCLRTSTQIHTNIYWYGYLKNNVLVKVFQLSFFERKITTSRKWVIFHLQFDKEREGVFINKTRMQKKSNICRLEIWEHEWIFFQDKVGEYTRWKWEWTITSWREYRVWVRK